jgi:hypothetical protein
MLRFKGRCTVTVQPAGSARIFVTVSGDADTNKEVQIELVVREGAAKNLACAHLRVFRRSAAANFMTAAHAPLRSQ